jgi:hypothetical protein
VTARLLVAIHDVTPAHADALGRIYALLERLEIARYALLVVPDWHGEWSLERHPRFVDDLLRRQAAGVEIFLHGYRHDEAGFPRSLMQHLRIAGRTAHEAEFRVIPPEEAGRRLDAGLGLFQRLGLRPQGFVPPAWLHGARARAQLRERGLRLTEGFWVISDLDEGIQRFAPALSWSSARAYRSSLTAAIAAARCRVPRLQPVVRVAIHPPDILIPVVARSVEGTLRRLRTERALTTYREACSRIRSS